MAEKRVSLKLLIDKQQQKVVFAESGKDFVDFLFTILTLPIGNVVKLLTKPSMVGCLGKLYESVETLDQTYMQPNKMKSTLLSPINLPDIPEIPLLKPIADNRSSISYYGSSVNEGYVKEATTYTIMDNLVVKPMSTISGLTLLTQMNIKEIGALEERTINMDIALALDLLEASLRSDTILTDVFLVREEKN